MNEESVARLMDKAAYFLALFNQILDIAETSTMKSPEKEEEINDALKEILKNLMFVFEPNRTYEMRVALDAWAHAKEAQLSAIDEAYKILKIKKDGKE